MISAEATNFASFENISTNNSSVSTAFPGFALCMAAVTLFIIKSGIRHFPMMSDHATLGSACLYLVNAVLSSAERVPVCWSSGACFKIPEADFIPPVLWLAQLRWVIPPGPLVSDVLTRFIIKFSLVLYWFQSSKFSVFSQLHEIHFFFLIFFPILLSRSFWICAELEALKVTMDWA